ncbi:MAG: hypothetical protein AAFP19_06135, partial [Bacteroidota bacterium]
MEFVVKPILDQMAALYRMPRDRKRFEHYLFMLQGNDKDNLLLPISGYNPMGKEQVLAKLEALQSLRTEALIEDVLKKINPQIANQGEQKIEVVINLADDAGGAWSNRYTVDHNSKFDLAPMIRRNFCTPYFWTSERYSKAQIIQIAQAYVYRSIFWLTNQSPQSLKDFLAQEVFVAKASREEALDLSPIDLETTKAFYRKHQ